MRDAAAMVLHVGSWTSLAVGGAAFIYCAMGDRILAGLGFAATGVLWWAICQALVELLTVLEKR